MISWKEENSDYEATRLVTSSCSVSFPPGAPEGGLPQGPSSISVQSITGGSAQTTFTTPKLAITQVRLLGYKSTSLLLIMENQNFGASISVDTSQNGLWEVNTDGSGLTRLTTESAGNESSLNQFTQYPWSNVSLDGKLYALQVTEIQGTDPSRTWSSAHWMEVPQRTLPLPMSKLERWRSLVGRSCKPVVALD